VSPSPRSSLSQSDSKALKNAVAVIIIPSSVADAGGVSSASGNSGRSVYLRFTVYDAQLTLYGRLLSLCRRSLLQTDRLPSVLFTIRLHSLINPLTPTVAIWVQL